MKGLCHSCNSSNELITISDKGMPICNSCKNPGQKTYQKTATITAVQMDLDFEVKTLEGLMKGHAGDYLATGIQGEQWPIKKDIFEKTYKLT